MRDNARWSAAIDILDVIFSGRAAEYALLNWARGHRFAGAKDRAAIRDLVFDGLRNYRRYGFLGGAQSGRGVMIGRALAHNIAIDDIFSGQDYAPSPLGDWELANLPADKQIISQDILYSIPDWLHPQLSTDERAQFASLVVRAPIDLRVNPRRATVARVQRALQHAGVDVAPISGLPNGLRVPAGARGLQNLPAYQDGWFEFQDAGAQHIMNRLAGYDLRTALDYCAGGGGKTLALGASHPGVVLSAYDINARRMDDLAQRAKRANITVDILSNDPVGQGAQYDLLILDVPCSGSGAWRRHPDAKLHLTSTRLTALIQTQQNLLRDTRVLTPKGGLLLYITCSIFADENQAQIAKFLAQNPDYQLLNQESLTVCTGHDGFFMALMQRTDH